MFSYPSCLHNIWNQTLGLLFHHSEFKTSSQLRCWELSNVRLSIGFHPQGEGKSGSGCEQKTFSQIIRGSRTFFEGFRLGLERFTVTRSPSHVPFVVPRIAKCHVLPPTLVARIQFWAPQLRQVFEVFGQTDQLFICRVVLAIVTSAHGCPMMPTHPVQEEFDFVWHTIYSGNQLMVQTA